MPVRNTHPLNDLLHIGREPASGIAISDDIGPYPQGTTVQELLEAWGTIVDAVDAAGFSANAVKRKTWSGLSAWGWVRRMTSIDPVYAYINGFAYSNGLWVAVGDADDISGQLYWAHDPEGEWTRQLGWPQIYLGSVATDGTTWAIAASGQIDLDGIDGRIWTSPEPSVDHHWTVRLTDSSVGLESVYYANSHWVAWAASGAGSRLYTAGSTPTGTWTSRSTSGFTSPGPIDITFGNSTWVAISGNGSNVSTASTPTGTWTNAGAVGISGADKIKYANGYWIIVGFHQVSPGVIHGGPWYATSPTGPWTEVTSPALRVTVDMLWDGTRWVVLGADSSFVTKVIIATNPAGTWTNVTAPAIDPWRLAFDGRVYLAGGVGTTEATAIETALNFAKTAITANAFIAGGLSASAVLRKVPTGSFSADAMIFSTTVTADAVFLRAQAGSLKGDAFVPGHFSAQATITGFTANAVIVPLMDTFQFDTFQSDTFQ
jgi:hypothetical protein